jgi:hypothetical protein
LAVNSDIFDQKYFSMALFRITAKQNSHSNGLRLEKGMSVQVASKYSSNPIVVNGGQEVQDAFMRIYGLDLKKLGGGGIPAHLLEVVKI